MASPKQRYLPINNSVPTLNQPVITLSRNLLVCSNINLSYCFCLCVDDFGVKYFSKDDANHLIQTLNNKYECTIDWEGKKICGLQLQWNYRKKFVDVSLPEYVQKSLQRLQHVAPKSPWYSPQYHHPINFSTKVLQNTP